MIAYTVTVKTRPDSFIDASASISVSKSSSTTFRTQSAYETEFNASDRSRHGVSEDSAAGASFNASSSTERKIEENSYIFRSFSLKQTSSMYSNTFIQTYARQAYDFTLVGAVGNSQSHYFTLSEYTEVVGNHSGQTISISQSSSSVRASFASNSFKYTVDYGEEIEMDSGADTQWDISHTASGLYETVITEAFWTRVDRMFPLTSTTITAEHWVVFSETTDRTGWRVLLGSWFSFTSIGTEGAVSESTTTYATITNSPSVAIGVGQYFETALEVVIPNGVMFVLQRAGNGPAQNFFATATSTRISAKTSSEVYVYPTSTTTSSLGITVTSTWEFLRGVSRHNGSSTFIRGDRNYEVIPHTTSSGSVGFVSRLEVLSAISSSSTRSQGFPTTRVVSAGCFTTVLSKITDKSFLRPVILDIPVLSTTTTTSHAYASPLQVYTLPANTQFDLAPVSFAQGKTETIIHFESTGLYLNIPPRDPKASYTMQSGFALPLETRTGVGISGPAMTLPGQVFSEWGSIGIVAPMQYPSQISYLTFPAGRREYFYTNSSVTLTTGSSTSNTVSGALGIIAGPAFVEVKNAKLSNIPAGATVVLPFGSYRFNTGATSANEFWVSEVTTSSWSNAGALGIVDAISAFSTFTTPFGIQADNSFRGTGTPIVPIYNSMVRIPEPMNAIRLDDDYDYYDDDDDDYEDY